MTSAIASGGATPAITAVVRGVPAVGVTPDELERLLCRDGVAKVSARDVPIAMARGGDGATTVAATLALAAPVGIEVFATGGLGGVHREAEWDESADLMELARNAMVVVCAGAKSILDLPRTMERLESLGVPVLGYRTDELPGFFTAETGLPVTARVESVAEVAEIFRAHRALGRRQAVVVAQAVPAEAALPREVVEAAVAQGLAGARQAGVRGAAVTPWLLGAVERATGGRSLGANLALLERNAALATEIAGALAP